MRKLLIVLFVLWAVPSFAAQRTMNEVAAGNTAFALKAYQKIRTQPGNIVFSPYSISTALAMTYAGARGATATQMAEALDFRLPHAELHQAFGALQGRMRRLQQDSPVRLNIANALWIQRGYEIRTSFTELTEKYYDANLFDMKFKQDPEAARRKINRWVEKKTDDRITDLLAKGTVDDSTRLVLTNAVYFKAAWKHQFKPDATRDVAFWLTPKKKTEVPTMYQQDRFGYREDRTMQVLEMPYEGADLSMFILLPKATDGLDWLESKLSAATLKKWTSGLKVRKVKVFLPKFRATRDLSLNKLLMSLGMVDAFSLKADFSGIEASKELAISDVIHQAFIAVDEAGTEAAAATAVVMMAMAAPLQKPVPVFRADHPFVFLIRDNRTGTILFMGRLSEPAR